jgi:hypothetical protein
MHSNAGLNLLAKITSSTCLVHLLFFSSLLILLFHSSCFSGMLCFVGRQGVGQTRCVKIIAKQLYDNDTLCVINMESSTPGKTYELLQRIIEVSSPIPFHSITLPLLKLSKGCQRVSDNNLQPHQQSTQLCYSTPSKTC